MKSKTVSFSRFIIPSLLFMIVSLFPSSYSYASDSVDVTDIRFWSYPQYTRVVISLSDTTEFTNKRLSNPDRLFFDIEKSTIKKDVQKNITVSNGMLKSVRASQFNEDTVRVVLDLEKVTDYRIINLDDPVRIMIDIYGEASISAKRRIVIDAGHGGHDPGAVGPNKLYEKDVVLDIARRLGKILSANPNFDIFFTRDSDVFTPLEERTAIANSKSADLFVSVHANASPNRSAKGIETYFLNWTDDEEAMKVAARENAISLKKLRKMQKEVDVLDIIKSDLSRDVKRDESLKLANYIQQTMVNNLTKDHKNINNLGVKWAPFYVLFGAKMPSVLVEVSFISNPAEEKLLAKDKYRNELAKSIALGVAKYMSAPREDQKMAAAGETVASRD